MSLAEGESLPGEPAMSASFAVLQRLAETLGLPVGVFMEQADGPGVAAPMALTETTNLLTAFSRIACPVARRRCIDLVEAAGRPEDAP